MFVKLALTAFLLLTSAAVSVAQTPARSCSPAKTNASCEITLNRESLGTPLPVRMEATATATLVVKKRPLDVVQLDETAMDIAAPDPIAAILAQFMPTLSKIVFQTEVSTRGIGTGEFRTYWRDAGADAPPSPAEALIRRLSWIDDRQRTTLPALEAAKKSIDGAADQLKAFRDRTIEEWRTLDFRSERDRLATALTDASSIVPPLGVIAALKESLTQAIEAYGTLPPPSPRGGTTAQQVENLGKLLNDVAANQARLETGADAVRTGQAMLAQAAGTVRRLDPAKAFEFQKRFPRTAAEVGRSLALKITVQDAVTKATGGSANVTVIWNPTAWEVSAGATFSWLENRAFQNSPIIVDGLPQLDGGKVNTVITETTTRPSVVPFILAHYRLVEGDPGGRRVALLVSGGMGVNVSSGTVEFGVGPTISYRLLMLTPMLHMARDLRLTNGLIPGQSLGPSPPALATERHWVPRFAIGMTLRIPF